MKQGWKPATLMRTLFPPAAVALVLASMVTAACQREEAPVADSPDPVRDLAERYAAAWCGEDPAGVAAFFSEEGSLAVNDGEPAVGRDAIAGIAQEFMTALPDMVVLFDGLEEVEGRVRFHWTLEATNSGPGGTGNKVRVSGYETWRLGDDGLIAESQGHFPTAEYERQLEVGYDGAAPSPEER